MRSKRFLLLFHDGQLFCRFQVVLKRQQHFAAQCLKVGALAVILNFVRQFDGFLWSPTLASLVAPLVLAVFMSMKWLQTNQHRPKKLLNQEHLVQDLGKIRGAQPC